MATQPCIVTNAKANPAVSSHLASTLNKSKLRGAISQMSYNAYTLWLFTLTDIKCIIVPHTILAIANAQSGEFTLSGSGEGNKALITRPPWTQTLHQLPLTVSWIWLNLMVECVANQRLPGSVQEDSINKPWRPLPSKRIGSASAQKLLFYLIVTAITFSYSLGEMPLKASTLLMSFIWLYNDLDGANLGPVMRNALNACGLLSFSVGGTAVAVTNVNGGNGGMFSPRATSWFVLLWCAIFTTIHAQDFADVEGDQARGRKSVPLLYGNLTARWSVAIPVIAWSIASPAFWGFFWLRTDYIAVLAGILVVGSGLALATMALTARTKRQDTWVWRLWCLWSATLFLLPLLAAQ